MSSTIIVPGSSLQVGPACKRGLTAAELLCLNSPWGKPDYGVELLPGVVQISTPSHGGFHLSSTRLAAMPAQLQAVPTFTGNPCWFEEDCDWALVAIGFPGLFNDEHIHAAVQTVRHTSYHSPASLWLSLREASFIIERATRGADALRQAGKAG